MIEITVRVWTGPNEVDFHTFEIPDDAEHLSVHVNREQLAALRVWKPK